MAELGWKACLGKWADNQNCLATLKHHAVTMLRSFMLRQRYRNHQTSLLLPKKHNSKVKDTPKFQVSATLALHSQLPPKVWYHWPLVGLTTHHCSWHIPWGWAVGGFNMMNLCWYYVCSIYWFIIHDFYKLVFKNMFNNQLLNLFNSCWSSVWPFGSFGLCTHTSHNGSSRGRHLTTTIM